MGQSSEIRRRACVCPDGIGSHNVVLNTARINDTVKHLLNDDDVCYVMTATARKTDIFQVLSGAC